MTRPASVHGGEFGLPDYPSVVHMLQAIAGQQPDACAIVCSEQRLSYAEYAGLVAGLASRFDTLGARGERIAVMLGNSIEMAVAVFAAHAAEAPSGTHQPAVHGTRSRFYCARCAALHNDLWAIGNRRY